MNRTVFTIVRHSTAPKPETSGQSSDDLRELSEEGRQLARECRKKLGNPNPDLVLVPPCLRHRETAILVAGPENLAPTIIVPRLFPPPGPDGDLLNAMFDRLGYKPLRSYHKNCSETELRCLRHFGVVSWTAVCCTAAIHTAKKVLAIGSAIYIPAMLFEAALRLDRETRDMILDWDTPDCGDARVIIDTAGNKVIEVSIW